ncbi:MFS transporter [Inquilinus limosus]|uniref:MFS transporter n=1 Tax=Inquilinus limosus TaxID=171674 RepID=UPI003F14C6D8
MAENGGLDRGGTPPQAPARQQARPVSARSRRGLDWFVFFVADIQTGFGAFVAVFLTTQKWTQVDIGLVLTVSGLVGLIGQMPLGAFVDAVRSVRITAAVALVVIGVSAFAFAAWPIFPVVVASRVLHAAASIIVSFCVVSISLGLVGGAGMSERLGRNAAFASAGTGIAAAVMGLCGLYLSSRSVFLLAAALVVPALFALSRIRAEEIRATASFHRESAEPRALAAGLSALARNRTLVIFAVCIAMFHLANATMMPIAASMVTLRSSQAATAMVAAAMIVPQLTVTFLSPWIGRGAQRWGRRPFLALGFAALALRALLFAMTGQPHLLVAFQVLDGVAAAVLGVLVPLTVADVTRQSGHFNLAQGVIGSAMGLGASVSTVLGGFIADNFGSYAAFMMLSAIATVGLVLLLLTMPETKAEAETEAKTRP